MQNRILFSCSSLNLKMWPFYTNTNKPTLQIGRTGVVRCLLFPNNLVLIPVRTVGTNVKVKTVLRKYMIFITAT